MITIQTLDHPKGKKGKRRQFLNLLGLALMTQNLKQKRVEIKSHISLAPEKIKDTPQAKRNAEKYSVELTVNAEEDNFCNSPVVNKNRNINASPEKAASKKSKRKITEVNECISDSDSDSSGDTSSGSDSDDSSMSESSSDEDDNKYRKRLDNTDEHGAVIRDWNEFVDKNEKWLRR